VRATLSTHRFGGQRSAGAEARSADERNSGRGGAAIRTRNAKRRDVLIEVRLSDEATKSGVPRRVAAVVKAVSGSVQFAPTRFDDHPRSSTIRRYRPYFRRMRRLRDNIWKVIGTGHSEPAGELSMGMSHDFEVAIEEGATEIRIGTHYSVSAADLTLSLARRFWLGSCFRFLASGCSTLPLLGKVYGGVPPMLESRGG